jgi:membrane protein involved in colicin uptake
MSKMSVFDELCATAAVKAPKDPNGQAFIVKLWKAIDNLSDKDWEALSEPAQNWSVDATKLQAADKDLPLIPGAPSPDAEEEEETATEEGGETTVAKKAAKKKAAAPAPAKKAAAPAPAKKAVKKAASSSKANGEKPRKSMLKAAREIICKAPHLNVDDICTKLEGLGYEAAPVTIGTIRSDTRNTLKIAQELKVDVGAMDFDK